MADGINKFEIDLGNLPLNDKQRARIAAKLQSVVLKEVANLAPDEDFATRLLVPSKFPDITVWGMWIDRFNRDKIFDSIDR